MTTDPGPTPGALPEQTGRRGFYGWWLVLAGAAVIAICGSGGGLPPITWFFDDAQTGAAGMAWLISAVLLLPFIGWAVDRWGARRMVLGLLAGLGGGFILLAGAKITAVFYLSSAVLGIVGAIGGTLPAMAAVNNWFRRRLATAIAVVILPSALVGFLIPFLTGVGFSIVSNAAAVSLVIGAVILAAAWPLSRSMRDRPEDYDQYPDGIPPAEDNPVVPDYTWKEAVRSRTFWIMAMGSAGSAGGSSGATIAVGLLMLESGLPTLQWGLASVAENLVSIPFILVGGMVGDRVPIRWAVVVFSLLQSIAIGLLLLGDTLPMILTFSVLMGIGLGGRAPVDIAIIGVYFGRRNFATIVGIAAIPAALMLAIAPVSVALMYESAGAWAALAAAASVSVPGALLFLLLGNPRLSPSQLQQADATRLPTPGAGRAVDG